MQALYDTLLCLPNFKKSATNLNEKAGYVRHSGLELLKKSKVHITVAIIEYVPHVGVSKTIIKKATNDISISSFDAGEFVEKISPFDNYIQIIEGTTEVDIHDKKYKLKLGEGIVIPAHTPHRFIANDQFKMISTIIKIGYGD